MLGVNPQGHELFFLSLTHKSTDCDVIEEIGEEVKAAFNEAESIQNHELDGV